MTARSVYLVTGAGSGIGAHLAVQLARPATAIIAHTGTNHSGLEEVGRACVERGAQVCRIVGNLKDMDTRHALCQQTQEFGALDGFAFTAGYAIRGGLETIDPELLREANASMPHAFLILTHCLLPFLAKRSGPIVAVSAFSASAPHRGGHHFTNTAPAKAALESAARALAAELAPHGIAVNSVSPGYVRKGIASDTSALDSSERKQVTRAIPMGRLGEPAEIASFIAFMLSSPGSYMTGQTIRIDGGLTL